MSDRLLENNRVFLGSAEMEDAPKVPRMGLAVISCMDARLTRLLPRALGIRDGDAAMIRNSGASIRDPYGDTMHSVLIAVYELGVTEIAVIGHTDCGARKVTADGMREHMKARGIDEAAIESADIDGWLNGLAGPEDEIMSTVRLISRHPLIPSDVAVRGYVFDTHSGRLTAIGAS